MSRTWGPRGSTAKSTSLLEADVIASEIADDLRNALAQIEEVLARNLALPRRVPRLGHLNVEQTWLVLVDAKNRVIREVLLSQGTLTSSLVHPREVFRLAIRAAAVGVVLVHNHPSGDPEPSPDDEALTRRLVAVGELVGIKLLDHLVVTDGAYVSLLERGLVLP